MSIALRASSQAAQISQQASPLPSPHLLFASLSSPLLPYRFYPFDMWIIFIPITAHVQNLTVFVIAFK
jgi:hypothetical protein